jgi:putative salt-induced outer membrane protein YdiY
MVSTNGNSKTSTVSAKSLSVATLWGFRAEFEGGALGASNRGQQTAENYFGSEKVSRNWSDRDYFFERFRWNRDRLAGIMHRYDASLGLGRSFVDRQNVSCRIEGSGGYTAEEYLLAPRAKFSTGRGYGRLWFKPSAGVQIANEIEYIHNFRKARAYRLSTDSSIQTDLAQHLAMKTTYSWRRNGEPPVEAAKDDTTLAVALILNF